MILDFISGIFSPAEKIIDRVVTTDKDRLELKNEFSKIQNEVNGKLLELQTDIIKAEAQSPNWLASNWRPITMLVFLVLIVLDQFDITNYSLSPEILEIIKFSLTGYVGGRSVEKILNRA